MNYKDFLETYAKENALHFSQVDEDTYKINSANKFLKVYFRENPNYLEGWGCFIDFAKDISLDDLKTYLNSEFKTNKMIIGLSDCYDEINRIEVPISTKIDKDDFDDETKYYLVCDFYSPAKVYKLENNKIVECPIPERKNPIEQLEQILKKRNKEYKVRPRYLELLECFDELILDQGETTLHIISSFFGTRLRITREGRFLDYSAQKSKVINLRGKKLEDVDLSL